MLDLYEFWFVSVLNVTDKDDKMNFDIGTNMATTLTQLVILATCCQNFMKFGLYMFSRLLIKMAKIRFDF